MKINSKLFFLLSGIAIGIGLFFGFVTPPLFKDFVKSKLNLVPESDLRQLYTKTPFFLNFKVYLFNLTNPDEVTEGGRPKVQEIGPYFFEEWKEKFDVFDNDEEDTLNYHFKNTFKFRPDLSGPGLTGNEIITIPHPLITTALLTLNVDKKAFLPLVNSAINILFNAPKHMFYTGRVMDILFDGIPIDCSSEDFQVRAVCTVLGSTTKAIRTVNSTHYAFSLLSQTNATDLGEITVFRGNKNSQDLGRVVAFNDESELDVWNGEECNEYRGTDSTIFPPYMNVSDGIWAFEPTICRSLNVRYVGKSKYMDVDTSEFVMDFGSVENSRKCFCRDEDNCSKKGTFDLYRCINAPVICSLPHFYGADPSLVANFASGIEPEKAKHSAFMHLETTTGTLLSGARRLQFNLDIVPIDEIEYMSELREMYYPMFWIEESSDLNETYVNPVKHTVISVPKIQNFLKWTGIIMGICGIIISSISMLLAVRSTNRMQTPIVGNKIGVHFSNK